MLRRLKRLVRPHGKPVRLSLSKRSVSPSFSSLEGLSPMPCLLGANLKPVPSTLPFPPQTSIVLGSSPSSTVALLGTTSTSETDERSISSRSRSAGFFSTRLPQLFAQPSISAPSFFTTTLRMASCLLLLIFCLILLVLLFLLRTQPGICSII